MTPQPGQDKMKTGRRTCLFYTQSSRSRHIQCSHLDSSPSKLHITHWMFYWGHLIKERELSLPSVMKWAVAKNGKSVYLLFPLIHVRWNEPLKPVNTCGLVSLRVGIAKRVRPEKASMAVLSMTSSSHSFIFRQVQLLAVFLQLPRVPVISNLPR